MTYRIKIRLLASAFLILPAVLLRAADSSLTLYHNKFAVVRGTVPLELREGMNEVRFDDTTAHLKPSYVILRDPSVQARRCFRNWPTTPSSNWS